MLNKNYTFAESVARRNNKLVRIRLEQKKKVIQIIIVLPLPLKNSPFVVDTPRKAYPESFVGSFPVYFFIDRRIRILRIKIYKA